MDKEKKKKKEKKKISKIKEDKVYKVDKEDVSDGDIKINTIDLAEILYVITEYKDDFNSILKWCLTNLYSVFHKDKGFIKFAPNKAQMKVLEAYLIHNRVIVLKSRQLGISTLICMINLTKLLFKPNSKIYLISETVKKAEKMFQNKIRDVYRAIGYDLTNKDRSTLQSLWRIEQENLSSMEISFQETEIQNDLGKKFNNMKNSYYSGASPRGSTITDLHITEVDALEKKEETAIDELETGAFPALPTNGYVVVESTVSKNYGYFKDTWDQAVENLAFCKREKEKLSPTEFFPIFVGWRFDEEEIAKAKFVKKENFQKGKVAEFMNNQIDKYDLSPQEWSYYYSKFKEFKFKKSKLLTEYPTSPEEAFSSPDNLLFDSEVLLFQKELQIQPNKYYNEELHILILPNKKLHYSIGIDLADGNKGGDNCAVSVLCIETGQEVANFLSDRFSATNIAPIVHSLAVIYNNAIVVPEINHNGEVFLKYFTDLGYNNIYHRIVYDNDSREETRLLGFRTTVQTKITSLNNLKNGIEQREIHLHDIRTIQEFRNCPSTFKEKLPTEATARSKKFKHFDMVMAVNLAYAGALSGQNSPIYIEQISGDNPAIDYLSYIEKYDKVL